MVISFSILIFYIVFRSLLIDFSAIGSTDEVLNGFLFLPSVNDMSLLHTMTSVNGPSHLFDLSQSTLIKEQGRIRYFVAGGNLDCTVRWILDSATIDSISHLAILSTSNRSPWNGFLIDGPGNLGTTPKLVMKGLFY